MVTQLGRASRLLVLPLGVGLALLMSAPARGDFVSIMSTSDPFQFAVLGQFSANQTNFNNGTITGNIGIGSPREFTASNGSVIGDIDFSGSSSTSGLSPSPDPGSNPGPFTVSGGGTVSGAVNANDAQVTSAINAVNSLSQTLGGEAGTSVTVTNGGSINASAGTLDAHNNRVFTVTSVSFNAGNTFTINGSASDFVVLNVGSSASFNGQIVLTGGITSDHVLINMFGGNYTTHTGGPTLQISANCSDPSCATSGIFLDPNGAMSINHAVLTGRFWGGDVSNQQIVSGADISAPATVPEPATLLLLGSGLLGLRAYARRRKHIVPGRLA